MLITLLVFILIIAVLVFVHELGHFLAAKRAGVMVKEFAFGFRPRIVGKQIGETTYAINAIPLGGYVTMVGEQGEDQTNPRSLMAKSIAQRFSIMVAGAFMNLLLGWLILVFLFIVGFQPLFTGVEKDPFVTVKPTIDIASVDASSPAAQAGMKSNDQIVSVNGQKLGIDDFVSYVDSHKGQKITIVANRNGHDVTFSLTPRVNPPANQGALGVSLEYNGTTKTVWYEAPLAASVEGVRIVWESLVGFFSFLATLVVHQQVSNNVTGIVGVGVLTGVARRLGITYLLQLVVAISVSLGVVNLLPILPLDGGHVAVLAYEKITHRRPSDEQLGKIATIGLIFVLFLFVVVSYNDIIRFNILGRF